MSHAVGGQLLFKLRNWLPQLSGLLRGLTEVDKVAVHSNILCAEALVKAAALQARDLQSLLIELHKWSSVDVTCAMSLGVGHVGNLTSI